MERTEFLDAVKAEFGRRRRRNANYSLRAYAKSLKVDQSLLSKVITGKRIPTAVFISKVAAELGFRKTTTVAKDDYSQLTEDYLDIVGDWLHFAILEFLKTKDASSKPEAIAKQFGVHPLQVELALKRLVKLGFLKYENRRYALMKPDNSWYSSVNTSSARKRLQKQLHEKALQSLDGDDFSQRDHSSLTVAIHPDHLQDIRLKITSLRRELDRYIEEKLDSNSIQPTEVYQLTFALFPLTRQNPTENRQ